MVLRAGYLTLAKKIQEAAQKMSNSDVQSRISDALNDAFRGTGRWCYLVDVFGTDKGGDCIYSCDSDLMKAAYTCSATGATVDIAAAVSVVPLTTYEVESGELTEAGRRNSTRDLKQLQTIHDHAASLGATCIASKEAAKTEPGDLKLSEGSGFLADVPLSEARSSYPVLLISPGTGSSAHYPASVLEESACKFKAGTLMFWNHPTAAQEAARPEGDLNDLAAILTSDAKWNASGSKGPGLYAEAKPMADYAQRVEERAPHIGLSIRAGGTTDGRLVEGKPVLTSITHVESVDYVTKAGRGGMALAEAARDAGLLETQEASMEAAEITKLIESAVAAAQAPLLERALRGDARDIATRIMEGVSLTPVSRARVVEIVMEKALPLTDGALDVTKFTESVSAAAKAEGEYVARLTGGGRVFGMGGTPEPTLDPKESERREAVELKAREGAVDIFSRLGMPADAAKLSAFKGAA